MKLGASMLSEKLGVNLDSDAISGALGGLLNNEGGELDLTGLASKMASSGDFGNIVSSWLGDGANEAISADGIKDLLGSDKLADFAKRLGTDTNTAADGLAQALPEMMDKSSSGGSLLEMAGGAEGLLGAAKKLFS
ncbi:MAG: YidB family protein [Congregibacter sp.]